MENVNHILVGLGGTGGKVLKAFKMRMFEEYPDSVVRNKFPVGLLYVDSTREMMGIGRPDFRVLGQDASFTENEFIFIKGVDIEQILNNINSYPALKGMVDNVATVKAAIGSLGEAAGQKRRAGRVLFAANAIKYKNALDGVYNRVNEISHTDELMIHIFTGLAGGTGSGSIIDAIVQTRKAYPNAKIMVYAMVPELRLPKAGMDKGRYYQNGYAALNELNGLQTGRFNPCDVTSAGKEAANFSIRIKGVADGVVLYSNVNENGVSVHSFDELPRLVSDYAYFRVFLSRREETEDFFRAYSFENMDDFCLEYDERSGKGGKEIVRSKKFNSFGIKRVIYPENRILQHMTYTVGRRLLYQFQFNNWRDNYGYVGEPANKDYKEEYLKEDKVKKWKIDFKHLMLEEKILPTEPNYESFQDYWHDKAIGYAQEAKNADCPLNELDNIMADFYAKSFRKNGVEKFYKDKTEIVNDLAREIRQNIERDLFTWWKDGVISLYDLVKIAETTLAFMGSQRNALDEEVVKMEEKFKEWDDDRKYNVEDWSQLNILQRMVGKGARMYAEHQEILTDCYVAKTTLCALEFAKILASRVLTELGNLSTEISSFYAKISKAIEECDRQIAANKKENKGIEDMTGAIIEVSEEVRMESFEKEMMTNKSDQPAMANELRKVIVPEGDFIPFADLTNRISVDRIKDAFDIRLSAIIKEKHEVICGNNKLLGMNILQQLQQVLTTDEEIQRFALELVRQSGVYLKFNDTEMTRYVPNNENPAENPSSINCKTILVSIPSPDENEELKRFAGKLENAFINSFNNAAQQTTLKVDMKSGRKDELSIVSVVYCFPLRAVDWLATYKERYEDLLHSADEKSNREAYILLHSEGDGTELPPIFIPDAKKPEEYWPYMFVAAATGILDKNEEGWGYSTTNKFGRKTTTVLTNDFVELIESDGLTEELRETIVGQVEDLLKDPEMTKADRQAMEEKIITIVGQEIVPVCTAKISEVFEGWAEEAINLIKK